MGFYFFGPSKKSEYILSTEKINFVPPKKWVLVLYHQTLHPIGYYVLPPINPCKGPPAKPELLRGADGAIWSGEGEILAEFINIYMIWNVCMVYTRHSVVLELPGPSPQR